LLRGFYSPGSNIVSAGKNDDRRGLIGIHQTIGVMHNIAEFGPTKTSLYNRGAMY